MIEFQKAWKFYFWFSLLAFLAGLVLELKIETTEQGIIDTILNISTYIVEVVALACLYGFAWQFRFGKRIFWAIFFFVSIVFFGYTIGYEVLFNTEELRALGSFLFILLPLIVLLLVPQFVANYLYAFHCENLWENVS